MALNNLYQYMNFAWGPSPGLGQIGGPTTFDASVGPYYDESEMQEFSEQEWVDWMQTISSGTGEFGGTVGDLAWLPGTVDANPGAEGYQSTYYYGMFGGTPELYGSNYYNADDYQIARYVGQEGFGIGEPDLAEWFQLTFTDRYQFAGFATDPVYGWQAQIEENQEVYNLQEGNLWEGFFTWQTGALGVIEEQFEGWSADVAEEYVDAGGDFVAGLHESIEKRSLSEEQKSAELTQERRRAGRTEFGIGPEYSRLLAKMKVDLSGIASAASTAASAYQESIEGTTTTYGFQAENAMNVFFGERESRIQTLGQTIEGYQDTFEGLQEDVYFDWAQNIQDITEDIVFDSGDMIEDEGEFNPFGGESGFQDFWCPNHYVWNSSLMQCELEEEI